MILLMKSEPFVILYFNELYCSTETSLVICHLLSKDAAENVSFDDLNIGYTIQINNRKYETFIHSEEIR